MNAKCLPLNRYPQDAQVTHRGLRVTRTWRPSGLSVPSHAHALTCLALCVGGAFDETVGQTWHRVSRHTLIVRPGGVPHANKYASGAPTRALIVELLPDALEAIASDTRVVDAPGVFESPRYVSFGRRLDAEFQTDDTVSGLAIEALVYELIVSAARDCGTPSVRPEWLQRVRDYLQSEFARTIRLSDVAAIADVHPSHVARTFRRVVGMTIGEYVRQLRLDRGAELLRRDQLPLADIAVVCGFHDQSHFSRLFKNRFGVSPSRYRSFVRG